MVTYTSSSDFLDVSIISDEITDTDSKCLESILNSRFFILSNNVLFMSDGTSIDTPEITKDTTNNTVVIKFKNYVVTLKSVNYLIEYQFDNTELPKLYDIYNKLFDSKTNFTTSNYTFDPATNTITYLNNPYTVPLDVSKFIYDLVTAYVANNPSLSITDVMKQIIKDEITNIYSLKRTMEEKASELMQLYISISSYLPSNS